MWVWPGWRGGWWGAGQGKAAGSGPPGPPRAPGLYGRTAAATEQPSCGQIALRKAAAVTAATLTFACLVRALREGAKGATSTPMLLPSPILIRRLSCMRHPPAPRLIPQADGDSYSKDEMVTDFPALAIL